jgi:hypothetical protein
MSYLHSSKSQCIIKKSMTQMFINVHQCSSMKSLPKVLISVIFAFFHWCHW